MKHLKIILLALAFITFQAHAKDAHALDDSETALWKEVQKGNSKDDYDVYLTQYPKGKYTALAKSRLKKLDDEAAKESSRKEQEAWESANQTGNEDGYNSYLKSYPGGRYVVLAKARIKKLQTNLYTPQEQALWQQAQAGENARFVQAYLDRYPNGNHVVVAREKLTTLRKAEATLAVRQDTDRQHQQEEAAQAKQKREAERQRQGEGAEAEAVAKGPAMARIPGRNYEMGKFEVTLGEWKAVMGSSPPELRFKNCGDTCPVENVSWMDAKKYLQKLNQMTGRQYRLPTEAEWEYACYGGSQSEFCGGKDENSVAWHEMNSGGTIHPAGQKQANGYGLYDMSGNVWEWVEDKKDKKDIYEHEFVVRVVRGGSWSNRAENVRAVGREADIQKTRKPTYGFRLARTLP